jgi:hypothetical protein
MARTIALLKSIAKRLKSSSLQIIRGEEAEACMDE